jgi:hypothetical protein
MLLTGLVSCRFSSLAEGSPVGDWATAPKPRVSLLGHGERSERVIGAKGSPIASLCMSTSGGLVALTPGTTDRIPAVKAVRPKFDLSPLHIVPNNRLAVIDKGSSD